MKESTINIKVRLDSKNLPENITWNTDDQDGDTVQNDCKGMLLSLFEKERKETIKIDLWTKEMQIQEMDRFFFQTLRALGDTYFKATQNKELAEQMQQFVHYFGQKTGIIPADNK